MNDQEYFEHYMNCFETVFSSVTEDWVYLKNADFQYVSMTDNVIDLFGAKTREEIIGKTPAEVAVDLRQAEMEVAEQFMKQDIQIKKTRKRGIYLETLSYKGSARIFVIYKSPIINPATDNFIGIRGQLTNLLSPHVIKTLFKMHGAKGLLLGQKGNQNALKEYPLTNMQHMVLFLCLNNYSYSEIALLMNVFGHDITPIKVNDYLEQLKLIFHVRTKTQLIEKAIGLNFHAYLPGDLFNKLSSIDISNETAAIVCCNCKLNICTEHQQEEAS